DPPVLAGAPAPEFLLRAEHARGGRAHAEPRRLAERRVESGHPTRLARRRERHAVAPRQATLDRGLQPDVERRQRRELRRDRRPAAMREQREGPDPTAALADTRRQRGDVWAERRDLPDAGDRDGPGHATVRQAARASTMKSASAATDENAFFPTSSSGIVMLKRSSTS